MRYNIRRKAFPLKLRRPESNDQAISVARIGVSEIATASMEQSQGIDQVADAISRMDKVTQASTAQAEETASTAEELLAQSSELDTAVISLDRLVTAAESSSNRVVAVAHRKKSTQRPDQDTIEVGA